MSTDENQYDPAQPVAIIPGDDLTDADPTPGMHRKLASHSEGMWTGTVDTQPNAVSGWHHHGDHETTIYVVEGTMRLESGPNGETVIEAGPGDFIRVPKGAVHRESNPGESVSKAVLVRCGTGVPTVNVDGPPQAAE